MNRRRKRLLLIVFLGTCFQATLMAQSDKQVLSLDTGKEIFEAACIGCHGPGAKGQPESTLGFEPPETFPDFSDCLGSAREKTYDWRAIIRDGGPARGFVEIMPAFGDALTTEQIDKVMQYLREQCTDSAWPEGEFNFPRPLITEKAFPEDEWVLETAVSKETPREITSVFVYEKRFGARNQIEIAVPFNFQHRDNTTWIGGVGDFLLGYKRTLFHSIRSGSILSWQGEVVLPTGDREREFGAGATIFETFASFGQRLPRRSFIQIQSGAEAPSDSEKIPRAAFFRTAVGKTFAVNQGFGRIWTPMVEFLVDREFETGARTNWDVVPQMQVSLSKRQHVFANFGVRTPINNRLGRRTEFIFHVLWDWFDGGLREGW